MNELTQSIDALLQDKIDGNLLEIARAVHDALLAKMPALIGKAVDDRLAILVEKLPSPVVNVINEMPAQAPPTVNVSAAPPRLVEKFFEYMPDGRPLKVIERELPSLSEPTA